MNSGQQESYQVIPEVYYWLLARMLPKEQRDWALGDLQEEYSQRSLRDPLAAKQWIQSQTSKAVGIWLLAVLKSNGLIQSLMCAFAALCMPVIYLMVIWLSNMDETSPIIWEQLLAGEMHKIVLQPQFWSESLAIQFTLQDWHMFVHHQALLWAVLCLALLSLRQHQLSTHQLALVGSVMMVVPYVLGIVLIEMFDPAARKIGPLLAFMLFCVFYLAIPLAVMIFRHQRQRNCQESTL